MPGVPKSQGCQSCKLRKIKCDETWPTCANCEKSNLICPGPTQLFKFVHNNFQVTGKNKLRAITPNEHGLVSAWQNLQRRAARKHDVCGARDANAIGEGGHTLPKESLHRPISAVADERVISHLVAHLDTGLKRIGYLNLTFAMHLPKRLSQSTCLRDSVDFFCTALVDFQKPCPKGVLQGFPQYGKALKSLRMALLSEDALKAETLAAVAVMERAASLLERWGRTPNIHFKAAIQLMRQRDSRGTVNTNDELDVALCRDLRQQAVFGWTVKGADGQIDPLSWEDAFAAVSQTQERISKGEALSIRDLEALSGCCYHLNSRLAQFQAWLKEPVAENKVKSMTWNQDLCEMEETMGKLSKGLLENALRKGTMDFVPMEAGGIVEKRYDFTCPLLCLVYLIQLFTQLVPLSIMQETHSILHGKTNDELHTKLREVAMEIWKCGPYIQSLDPMLGPFPVAPFHATYEIADSKEKEYVLELAQHMDKFWGKLPKTIKEQRRYLSKIAMVLTGRDPEAPYF